MLLFKKVFLVFSGLLSLRDHHHFYFIKLTLLFRNICILKYQGCLKFLPTPKEKFQAVGERDQVGKRGKEGKGKGKGKGERGRGRWQTEDYERKRKGNKGGKLKEKRWKA